MVTGKGLAPIFEYPHKATVGKLPGHHIFWQEPQPTTRDGSAQDRHAAVERPLSFDTCLEFVTVLLKIPLHQAPVGGQAQIDAIMCGQIPWLFRIRPLFEVFGRPHYGDAQRGADRDGDHVLGHLIAQAHARVVALRDDVAEGVVDGDFDLDVRVVGKHLRQLGPKDVVRRMFGG
ncbi:hypothetical protein D3C81_1638200 [compost metagenome]